MSNLHFFCFIIYISFANSRRSPLNTRLLPHNEFLKIINDENADCPCDEASLCNNVKTQHDKELFGFGGGHSFNTSIYNWTYLTTIAWAPYNKSDLLCTAHQNKVRLIASTHNIPLTNNATQRMEWIQQTYQQVSYYHFDGITFDYEEPMLSTDIKAQQYVDIINETTQYFHDNMPGSQTSVCVAWTAYLTDGREYPYYDLSLVSDLLYIMDYDTQSQNWQHQCLAAANAPYQGTQRGIESYLNLGIDAKKLILGVPWYGYNYTCDMNEMESLTSKYCPIPFDPFRGVNCSDAAGNEKEYAILYNLVDTNMNITEIRWDSSMRAPYFNYKLSNSKDPNQVFQAWFDNPQSLSLKYSLAKSYGLRGVGPFTFAMLYDSHNAKEIQRAQEIWSSFDSFFV